MNRRLLTLSLAAVVLTAGLALNPDVRLADDGTPEVELRTSSVASADRSLDHCLRQIRTEWGGACGDGALEVRLQNTCRQALRMHWCVRENTGRLRCGLNPSLAPRAVSTAHSCDARRPAELLIEACPVGARCRVRAR